MTWVSQPPAKAGAGAASWGVGGGAVGGRGGGVRVGDAGDGGEALHAGRGADEGRETVTVDGGLLVALLDREALHTGRHRGEDGRGVEGHGPAGGLGVQRVVGLT